jgi:hypothetical protein
MITPLHLEARAQPIVEAGQVLVVARTFKQN